MKHNNTFKRLALISIWAWLSFFVLLAFCLIVWASFFTSNEKTIFSMPLTLLNYQTLFSVMYLHIFLKSLWLAAICVFFCLCLGYPFAYFLTRIPEKNRHFLLILLILPFWTSSLVRTYALMALFKTKGIINASLLSLGLIHAPIQLLFTNTAVMLGLIYNLLPFMILPLYAHLEKFDTKLIEAGRDLGASALTIVFRILLPLSMPGIIAGTILVLLPAMTLFYIPDLLGGAKSLLLGNLIEYQFMIAHNWPSGAAISVLLTILMAFLLLIYRYFYPAQFKL